MPETVANGLIYEILKRMQTDIGEMKATASDHSRQFTRVSRRYQQPAR